MDRYTGTTTVAAPGEATQHVLVSIRESLSFFLSLCPRLGCGGVTLTDTEPRPSKHAYYVYQIIDFPTREKLHNTQTKTIARLS